MAPSLANVRGLSPGQECEGVCDDSCEGTITATCQKNGKFVPVQGACTKVHQVDALQSK